MKRFFTLLLFYSFWFNVYGQQEAATSAPILNPFNLSGDKLGSMDDYVNQLTGEVSFPLNLVSVPGPGGLGISVGISYNSGNIENQVDIWNREAPTGILGLGWSMDVPLVMVDNKQTGTREDDEFYLVESGSSIRLICVGVNGGVRSYRTSSFTNWVISYTESSEKWEVTKDDGTKFIYGDTQGSANAVQWTCRWGNWMGNSLASGQQLQGLIWNLREVRSAWGDRITYSYYVGNISAGAGILSTEYSLLLKINDSWGHEVEFVPGQKSTLEYQCPPGLIHKRSERFFISKILVKTNGSLDYEYQFVYSTNELGTDQLTKRLLKSIKKVLLSGATGPTISFDYAAPGQANKGALTKVTFPTGGSATFTYNYTGYYYLSQVAQTESAPSGYKEPDVFIADDYALVTWRQLSGGAHIENPMSTIGRLIDWRGKWRTIDLGHIGYTKRIRNDNELMVALGKDFFATLIPYYGSSNYTLTMWHRQAGAPDEWARTSETLDMGTVFDYRRVRVFSGNNFICATNNRGKIFRFVWGGNAWMRSDIDDTPGDRWTTATNNYILSHNPNPEPDAIKLYYLDQLMDWQTKTQSIPDFNTTTEEDAYSHWYPANSSAFVMANQSNEMVIQWDENYNNISKVDMGWYYGDNSRVYFDGTTVGLVTAIYYNSPNPFPLSKSRAMRRDGYTWVDSGEKIDGYGWLDECGDNIDYGTAAFGPDIMLWNSNSGFSSTYEFKYKTFDPATSQWSSEVQLSNTDNPHVDVGPDYFTVGRRVYFKRSSGYVLSTVQYLNNNDDVHPSSQRFIASSTKLIMLKNGDMTTYPITLSQSYRVRNSPYPGPEPPLPFFFGASAAPIEKGYEYMVGSSIFALCSYGFNDHFDDDTSVEIRRVTSVAGAYDHPVIRVQVDDGTTLRYTSFDYSNPVFGPNEATVMYNKVTKVPGSSSSSSRPFGHVDTYFYNSLNSTEVSSPFPASMPLGNGFQYHSLLTGQSYRIAAFNSTPDTVSASYNITNVSLDYYSTGLQGFYYMYTPRPYQVITKQDGKQEVLEFTFNQIAGGKREMTRKTVSTKYSSGLWDQRYDEPTYAWQVYSFMEPLNMLTQTALSKGGILGGAVINAAAVRWKQWTCSGPYCAASTVPAPYDQYAWRGTNSSSFSAWDVATQTPNSDWRLGQKILTRDSNLGMELEVTSKSNEKSATVLDNLKRQIALASNAGLSDISFSSFEDGTTGLWSSSDGTVVAGAARTGTKHFSLGTNGLSRAGLSTSTTYRITFWAKSAGGSVVVDGVGTVNLGTLTDWTLFQYSVTSLTTIGVRRSGSTEVLLDEVRLHPANSMMSTKTYHATFGVDSETDTNNRTMFTEFDEFGRPKLIRDQDRFIVKHFFSNTK